MNTTDAAEYGNIPEWHCHLWVQYCNSGATAATGRTGPADATWWSCWCGVWRCR